MINNQINEKYFFAASRDPSPSEEAVAPGSDLHLILEGERVYVRSDAKSFVVLAIHDDATLEIPSRKTGICSRTRTVRHRDESRNDLLK